MSLQSILALLYSPVYQYGIESIALIDLNTAETLQLKSDSSLTLQLTLAVIRTAPEFTFTFTPGCSHTVHLTCRCHSLTVTDVFALVFDNW